jgi:hypothetical protein
VIDVSSIYRDSYCHPGELCDALADYCHPERALTHAILIRLAVDDYRRKAEHSYRAAELAFILFCPKTFL